MPLYSLLSFLALPSSMQWVPCIKIPLFLIIRIVSVYFGCILIDTESLQENAIWFIWGTYCTPSIVLYTRETMLHKIPDLPLRRSESSQQAISQLSGQHYDRARLEDFGNCENGFLAGSGLQGMLPRVG